MMMLTISQKILQVELTDLVKTDCDVIVEKGGEIAAIATDSAAIRDGAKPDRTFGKGKESRR